MGRELRKLQKLARRTNLLDGDEDLIDSLLGDVDSVRLGDSRRDLGSVAAIGYSRTRFVAVGREIAVGCDLVALTACEAGLDVRVEWLASDYLAEVRFLPTRSQQGFSPFVDGLKAQSGREFAKLPAEVSAEMHRRVVDARLVSLGSNLRAQVALPIALQAVAIAPNEAPANHLGGRDQICRLWWCGQDEFVVGGMDGFWPFLSSDVTFLRWQMTSDSMFWEMGFTSQRHPELRVFFESGEPSMWPGQDTPCEQFLRESDWMRRVPPSEPAAPSWMSSSVGS